MKPFYTVILSLFTLFILSTQVKANRVIVKGNIKYANGSPAVNQKVKIAIEVSSANNCDQSREVSTNSTGHYEGVLECISNILKVKTSTADCKGFPVVHQGIEVPASGTVEDNFTICNIAPATHCEAVFSSEQITGPFSIRLNSSLSHGVSTSDNIIKRRWKFGDGKILEGNEASPVHVYEHAGNYEVCLTINTAAGCEKSICKMVQVVAPAATCKADFSVVSTGKTIKLNSSNSQSSPGDIISRRWQFGDGKVLEGNIKDPSYEYAKAGTYEVCLTIKTNVGCESSVCKRVEVVAPTANQCAAKFSYEKLSAKKVRFNSSSSVGNSNSNIIERKWDFGDGTSLVGNEISPAKEYAHSGIYTVCLQIKTSDKCDNRVCTTIHIEESTSTHPPGNNDYIKIVSLHPNPATSPLTVEVWSLTDKVNAELTIYDIYGVKKWSTTKVLLHGTNITVIPISQLGTGPYFLKVSSMYGVQSKPFYKL